MFTTDRTVFFDLGNVLLFFDSPKMFRQIAQASALDLHIAKELIVEHTDLYEKGHIDTKKVHELFNQKAKKAIDYEALRLAMCDIFQPNEAAIRIAQELRAKGVRLFILSNTCEAHFEFAQAQFDFFKLFDGYILSYKVGARKPEKKIFEEALRLAECTKEHCFYTDDIPEFINAAKELQIDAELFTTAEQLQSHLHERNFL